MTTGSPIVPRRRLGSELRRLRERAGRSLDDAARVLDCSASKISRLETGKGIPRARDIRDLLAFYGPVAEQQKDTLLQWARDGQAQGWWNDYRDVVQGERFPEHLSRLLALESGAREIQMFEPAAIPGLLQTEEYIREISRVAYPEMADTELQRLVAFRLQRQEVLRRTGAPVRLRCVLDEVALLRPLVDRRVHERQLRALRDRLDEHPDDVELRVFPLQASVPEAVGGPFVIFGFGEQGDQDIVHFEGREGAGYAEDPVAVKKYTRFFEVLHEHSLSDRESRVRLVQLASG
jgi:transcriptional regulator with XRE-family HTH domain